MTKAEIVEQIYERVGFSKKEAAELVEKVFEIMKETLSGGEKVKISGFGNFVVREKNARKGRNPDRTGDSTRRASRLDFQAESGAEERAERERRDRCGSCGGGQRRFGRARRLIRVPVRGLVDEQAAKIVGGSMKTIAKFRSRLPT